jgi:hypothetical protein
MRGTKEGGIGFMIRSPNQGPSQAVTARHLALCYGLNAPLKLMLKSDCHCHSAEREDSYEMIRV